MPRRFNKAERDELLALITTSKKDDDDVHEDEDEKGASVLDALESKTANQYVKQRGDKWVVVKKDDGSVIGTHNSKDKAESAFRGMEMNMHGGKVSDVLSLPAQQNPDLIASPAAEQKTAPCTHCGASLAPFVVEHRLNCPHCGNKQEPIRWEGVMGSHTASPIFPEQQFAPPVQQHVHPNEAEQGGWGAIQPCRNCGHGMQTFNGQRGAMCPNCGNEEAIMAQGKVAEVSMPPQSAPYEQKETALPYNPGAYEGEVEGMHPAAQYTYQRAVAQGAAPQAAMAAAQEKQGEMMKRTQEGQNTEGVQIPVISRTGAEEEKCKDCGKPMNPVEAMVSGTHGVCGECTKRKHKEVAGSLDRDGFISVATIQRVSHLV